MKYRRIPGDPIEAVQWFQHSPYGAGRPLSFVGVNVLGFYVTTIHGQRAYLADGDWILPEPDGVHFYPCKPDIFAKTYEPVVDLPSGLPQLISPEVARAVVEPGQVEWMTRDYPPLTPEGARALNFVTEILAGLEARNAELEAQLAAEGEHTAAANANIDRLNTEIERVTRRQQGPLMGKE